MSSNRQKAFETITVDHERVVWDGGTGALGHPRVFLHIDREVGEITCGYCSRHYVLEEGLPLHHG